MLEDPFGYQEKQQERCHWRRVGFVAFAALVVALILLPLIAGCASTDEKICFMRGLGATEDGWTVVAAKCMTPEAFTESQK